MRELLVTIMGAMVFFSAAQSVVWANELIMPNEPIAQGEVVRVVLKGVVAAAKVRGVWQSETVEFFRASENEYASLLGIDLRLAPGKYPLEVQITLAGNPRVTLQRMLEVVAKDYGLQRLTLPPEMVTLDAETLKRVRKEGALFSVIWRQQNARRYWRGSFILPVAGEMTTPFGLRRIINGEPRSPHSGVDLKAPQGEPIRAANAGRVVLVGEFFFQGRTVVIDHGWGLYSMYFHLSQIDVAKGDLVEKSTVIGLVGSTGRSTGPHLHWGVRLGAARVDPFSLLRQTGG